MLGLVGQCLMFSKDALNPYQSNILQINYTEIRNAIFYYFNVTKDIEGAYSTEIPIEWTVDTIMNCDFKNLNAGNLEGVTNFITKILVKRKRLDAIEQPWVTLFEVPIEDQTELSFSVNDFTNVHGARYKYVLVPVYVEGQLEIEGTGTESKDVLSEVDGVFICSKDDFCKLYAGVAYGDMTSTQITGVHQTLGSKYPIVVINSNVGYNSGSVSGTVLNKDYDEMGSAGYNSFDRTKIVKAQNELRDFLLDNKPKIIKDWNGNAWLVVFTGEVNTSYFNEWGMGLADVATNWTEIGNVEDEASLGGAGFIGGA